MGKGKDIIKCTEAVDALLKTYTKPTVRHACRRVHDRLLKE